MIEVRVFTIWQGKVGIRDRYVAEAEESGQGLVIVYKQERMAIAHSQLRSKIVAQSEMPFANHFGEDSHYLLYFKWQPEAKQMAML